MSFFFLFRTLSLSLFASSPCCRYLLAKCPGKCKETNDNGDTGEKPNTANEQLAAEPYETISFAIPSKDMVDDDEDPEATWEHWDADEKVYSCQLLFK